MSLIHLSLVPFVCLVPTVNNGEVITLSGK